MLLEQKVIVSIVDYSRIPAVANRVLKGEIIKEIETLQRYPILVIQETGMMSEMVNPNATGVHIRDEKGNELHCTLGGRAL